MKILGMKSRLMVMLVATCLFFIFLTGCSLKSYDKTTLEFAKNGSIGLHIVEQFDESKYDFEELKALNEAEINVYNSYGKSQVTNKGCTLKDGIVRIDIEYEEDDAYFDMNNVILFYGTVTDAKKAGYNLVNKIASTEGFGLIDQNDWASLGAQHIAIVSEEISVKMPGKIYYADGGVTLTGSDRADVSGEGLHYIVSE